MSENKTQPNDTRVADYLEAIENLDRRADAIRLDQIMQATTGVMPQMWGPSIVGYGTYHYVYESGREGDTCSIGFAARKPALVIYGLFHYSQNAGNIALAANLGKHTSGKGCLYIKSLADIDETVLSKMISGAFAERSNY